MSSNRNGITPVANTSSTLFDTTHGEMSNLDQSQVEDDNLVEFVFQLTSDFIKQPQTNVDDSHITVNQSDVMRESQSPPASNVYPTRIGTAIGANPSKRRQLSEGQENTSQVTNSTHSTYTTVTHVTKTSTNSTATTRNVSLQTEERIAAQRAAQRITPRKKKMRSKSDLGLFNLKRFKTAGSQVTADVRQAGDGAERPDLPVTETDGKTEPEKTDPKKCFVHYDSRSILVDFSEASKISSVNQSMASHLQNIRSGATTAELTSDDSIEDLPPDTLLLDTPNFINETFDEKVIKNNVSSLRICPKHKVVVFEGVNNSLSNRIKNGTNKDFLMAGISTSDFTIDRRFLNFEHMDHGSNYYRRYFANFDHSNYFGTADPFGPVGISMRREKTDCLGGDRGDPTYLYRIIIRTAQLATLRGSILEDFLPTSSRGAGKIHFRDILDTLAPEIKQDGLKLGESSSKVVDELIKLDELPLNTTYKFGLVYCNAGQTTEEEMYNNKEGSDSFEEFMEMMGEKVMLKSHDSFKAGLDTKNDTTGTHSLYTRYNNCQIMFHVSTLLPYQENDQQQVLRKRHIGNDLVTVIFQEPGSAPFTPAHFRSHYQHVFLVVRVENPNTPETCYSIAVTRSADVPEFGPPIPELKIKKSASFRHFLLTKLINGENASYQGNKLQAMAKRTKEQYLKSYSDSLCTSTMLLPGPGKRSAQGRIGRSLSLRRKPRYAQRIVPELVSKGALKWNVDVVEKGQETPCILAISFDTIVIVEETTKDTIYLLPCKAVLGWTSELDQLRLYYDTGEEVHMRRVVAMGDDEGNDIDDIVKRLTCVSEGCETQELVVVKNLAGQLGFHIQFQGIVGDVRENGPAWVAGLRPGSRLLDVRGTLVAHLAHDQLITHLKGQDRIVVVALPPFPDGQPRRSLSQLQSPREIPRPLSTLRHQTSENVDETEDTLAPLTERRSSNPDEIPSRPESRESELRAMSRGSMIALNMLTKELGIEEEEHEKVDIDQLLESIVSSAPMMELEEVCSSLEARSSSSSRPQTPSHWESQISLQSDTMMSPTEKIPPLSPQINHKTDLTATKSLDNYTLRPDTGKRYALGSDNIDICRPISSDSYNTGKRFALGSENLNGLDSKDKPDISKIFERIERTKNEADDKTEADAISEIDAVVSMIDEVLESTEVLQEYLSESSQTRGFATDSEIESDDVMYNTTRTVTPENTGPPSSSSPYSSYTQNRTNPSPFQRRYSPPVNKTLTPSPGSAFARPHKIEMSKVDYQRKLADYGDDMSRAIEALDSLSVDTRRPSVSSSSLSEGSCQLPPIETSDSVALNSDSEQSTSDEEYSQTRHYKTMRRMRREGLLMEVPSDGSDQSRTSEEIPPSPLRMLMERARETQSDRSSEESTWVRTTLLRIAELEAALERSNLELQILRKQNREMEQTLEIVDEENAKIRRETERTSNQLSTFTQWVHNRQLV